MGVGNIHDNSSITLKIIIIFPYLQYCDVNHESFTHNKKQ